MSIRIDLTHPALIIAQAQPYYIGDDWSIKIQFTDENGDAVDITGKSFYSTIKQTDGTLLLLRESSDSSELELVDAANGIIRVYIKRTENTIPAGKHRFDVVQVAADSSESTWAIGPFEARARVTDTPLP